MNAVYHLRKQLNCVFSFIRFSSNLIQLYVPQICGVPYLLNPHIGLPKEKKKKTSSFTLHHNRYRGVNDMPLLIAYPCVAFFFSRKIVRSSELRFFLLFMHFCYKYIVETSLVNNKQLFLVVLVSNPLKTDNPVRVRSTYTHSE